MRSGRVSPAMNTTDRTASNTTQTNTRVASRRDGWRPPSPAGSVWCAAAVTRATTPSPAIPTVVTSRYHDWPTADTNVSPSLLACRATARYELRSDGSFQSSSTIHLEYDDTATNPAAVIAPTPTAERQPKRRRT